jgi:hypothetical protein
MALQNAGTVKNFKIFFGLVANICGLHKQEKNWTEVSEKKLSYGNLVCENIRKLIF